MANDCSNYLQVRGPAEDIAEFRETAAGGPKGVFHPHNFIPMPGDLQQTDSPNRDEENSQKLAEKYGVSDWHEWSIQNWGTGRTYESCVVYGGDDYIKYHFYSAWTPINRNVLVAASGMFPTLSFDLSYDEPDLCLNGGCHVSAKVAA